jgi:NTE family protein
VSTSPEASRSEGPVRAIVLAGGGARGAYEVGVLDYIFSELPKPLLERSRIQVVSGTSVGAIHACFIAATAHLPRRNIDRLVHMWRSLRIEQMLRLSAVDLARLPMDVRSLFTKSGTPPGVLINSEHLRQIVVQETPWPSIRDNLRQRLIDAVTVTATHISSGRTVVFVDRHDGVVPPWSRDRRVVAQQVRMAPTHALASAAIPFMFPAVLVDGAYYCDGGLRQNTPLSPALRLGADRVLVIGMRHEDSELATHRLTAAKEEPYPGPFLLIGKVLDALLLDHLDYDLARLVGFNTLLRDGRQAFGEDFDAQLNVIAQRTRGQSYRNVAASVIRPSRDIGEMATEFVFVNKGKLGALRGYILGKLAASDFLSHSDFLSYLLFDGRFAESLMELGRADADAARSELIAFLED